MLRQLCILALAFSAGTVHAACGTPAQLDPLIAVSEQARTVLLRRDFKAIDRMAAEFQRRHALLADGQPANKAMYNGLKSPVTCDGTAEESKWIAQGEALAKWRAASPASHAARLASAYFELASAWHARGTGAGGTLTEQQVTGMREHAEQARQMLYAMPLAVRADEQWYVIALELALAQGLDPEHFERLFDEAVKRFPNSYDIYYAKSQYLSPKWYGSQAEQRAFIEASASRKSLIAPYLYARLVWFEGDWLPFTSGLADWPRMKASVGALVTKYPNVLWANRYANLACVASDVPVLKAQLEKLGGDLNALAWRGGAATVQYCQATAEGKQCFTRQSTGKTFCE